MAAGLGALAYDHRGFSASDGEPRQDIDLLAQVRDYRHAITFARSLPEVDSERIGVWGSSSSGGHALMVAALDRRARCVVAQAPMISGPVTLQRTIRPDFAAIAQAGHDADREAQFGGAPPAMIPVVAEDPMGTAALPAHEAWEFFMASAKSAPAWKNEITLRSLEFAAEYDPGAYVARISPTPLLMIVMTHDTEAPTDLALDVYERALEPKRLVLLHGGHFAPYRELFDATSGAARDWFVEHLSPEAPSAQKARPGA